ncbi:hypothetical protein GF402_03065 [Candidatus Fermentibacteria bacterium]|nr:hypothetical protein [Candidatus Fermentibacteria bacterium]
MAKGTKGDKARALFEEGWLDIDAKIRRLKQDLELADRKGLGEGTLRAIGKQLIELKKEVSRWERRWLEFERKHHCLKESLNKDDRMP